MINCYLMIKVWLFLLRFFMCYEYGFYFFFIIFVSLFWLMGFIWILFVMDFKFWMNFVLILVFLDRDCRIWESFS